MSGLEVLCPQSTGEKNDDCSLVFPRISVTAEGSIHAFQLHLFTNSFTLCPHTLNPEE